ncbi:hypothetical protein ACHWQZ_G017594 [Mnemiopsis leidyi]
MPRSLLFGRQGISSTLWKYHTKRSNIQGKRPPVLFTQYWMRVLPPRQGLPENTVMFECSFQMNKSEIRDYLKDIYSLESLQINTEIVDGERFKYQVPELGVKTHTNTHKKIAYVVLKDKIMNYPSNEFFKLTPKTVEETSSSSNPPDLVPAPS